MWFEFLGAVAFAFTCGAAWREVHNESKFYTSEGKSLWVNTARKGKRMN